ncbi:hypothetical protein F5Y00DRAFT_261968 [Daldinia vernicosa]|uniref:uncharacterized protein n=1 Tax=Daldinia vernicosa TaxID=114800 RepID=UPI00200855D8|nr:uncharacterized protein F5Y00DRAFT_261968 [Daldinia vernicosa]KAI0849152.1 hypothetical protein F5Y00DRAFT_261968 [Daldinia vernicosa]
MPFFLIYLTVSLLVCVGADFTSSDPSTSLRSRWPGKETWEDGRVRPYYAVDHVKVKEEIVSPKTIVEVLDRYMRIVQNPAIRTNYYLRAVKATEGNSALLSPFYSATFGEWWTHRQASAVPEDPVWFDGTLVEGLLEAINITVNYHVPQLLSVRPGWHYENESEIYQEELPTYFASSLFPDDIESYVQDGRWEGVRTHIAARYDTLVYLHRKSKLAGRHLHAAAKGQKLDVLAATGRAVDMLITRARRIASELDELDQIYESFSKKPESADWLGSSALGSLNPQSSSFISRVYRKIRYNIFTTNRSKRQDVENYQRALRGNVARTCAEYYVKFLRDENEASNGTMVRRGIHQTYEALRYGTMISREDIESTIDGVLRELKRYERFNKNSQKELLQKNSQEDRVQRTIKELGRVTQIRQFAEDMVAAANSLTRDLDHVGGYRRVEAEKAQARSQGQGWLNSNGKLLDVRLEKVIDEKTGQEITIYYDYEYQIDRPKTMGSVIRSKADELEYIWHSVQYCENDLAYLNICEVTRWNSTQKAQKLEKEFRERANALDRKPPTCDELGNLVYLKSICKEKYLGD